MAEQPRHCVVPIVPCNDIDASVAFYERLGLGVNADFGGFKVLSDGKGWLLHLSAELPEGWVVPDRNPNALYFYLESVDELANTLTDLPQYQPPAHKPWGMYEFSLPDPDGTWIRIGWPSRLMKNAQ